KLTHVASAYYKGDERNPQLQRIYGTAFKNKTEMEAYFNMLEEAKRRDHRKIGAEMGLYVIDTEYVGPGLPLWLPKGTAICEELEKLAKETEFAAGYVRVKTPHLAKEKLYLTSGHLPVLYKDSMFPPMSLLEEANRAKHEQLTRQKFAMVDELLKLKSGGVDASEVRIKELERESFDFTLEQDKLGERYYLKAMNC